MEEIFLTGIDGKLRCYGFENSRIYYIMHKSGENVGKTYWLERETKKPSHLTQEQHDVLIEKLNQYMQEEKDNSWKTIICSHCDGDGCEHCETSGHIYVLDKEG